MPTPPLMQLTLGQLLTLSAFLCSASEGTADPELEDPEPWSGASGSDAWESAW